MPELPEVERGRRLAASVAQGRTIIQVRCAQDTIVFQNIAPIKFQRALKSNEVLAIRRHGKFLWFELDHPPHPLFHFGMTGAFHTPAAFPLQLKSGPKTANPTWPPRFTKIHLFFDDGGELVMTNARRLGRILLRKDPLNEPPLNKLGFDPLLNPPTTRSFEKMLQRRSAIIKSLLLDQSFSAGVGNWIADEVLYQAGIDPRRRADSLSHKEAKRLHRALKSVIKIAVKANADSTRYPRYWLFHERWGKREGAITARGDRIAHTTIAGRTTAWVPTVQS
ncbi:MAG: hypothetical protein IH808_13920 [Proteobacteria bacterium]|nr:hypothetical protein [Pseudomonadota bacterium]